jgi:hypothetical protein
VLHLLVDTSTWLDLAKRRDGQKWIVALRVFALHEELELLVPALVLDEFGRNRPRIEQSMTSSVSERFRLLKADLDAYGGEDQKDALEVLDGLAHQVPLIGAMTTRNFDEIEEMLGKGRLVEPTPAQQVRVVQRGLAKQAPFHRSRNSVADALLVELYGSAISDVDLTAEPHCFVTSNSEDFSMPGGDKRKPHPDLAPLFARDGSSYGLGVDGLATILAGHFGEEYEELLEDSNFQEEPRRLDEILEAEQEFFDRIWYQRSLAHESRRETTEEMESLLRVTGPSRRRVEEKFEGADNLGRPYDDFGWGMLNGKLSALRWVLGSEWDFLDT